MLFSRFARAARLALMLPVFFLSAPAWAGNMADTDLPGGDYRNFSLISPVPSFCANVCARDSRCKAWTFSWPGKRGKRAKCFLKDKLTKKSSDTCCISGVKSGFSLPGAARAEEKPAKEKPAEERPAEEKPKEPGKEAPARTPPAGQPDKRPGAKTQTPAETQKPESGKRPDDVDKKTLPPVKAEPDKPGAQTPERQEPQEPRKPQETPGGETPPPAGTPADDQAPELPAKDTSQPPEDTNPPRPRIDPQKAAACADYARKARAASALNRELGCGYGGARWNASYNGYYNWCLKNPASAAQANTAARTRLIRQCRNQPPEMRGARAGGDLESCARFSRLASALARRALRARCGFFGPWWTTDEAKIFRWCRNATVAQRRSALATRRAAVLRCESENSVTPPRRPRDGVLDTGRPRYRQPPASGALYKWTKLRGPGGPRGPWSTPWRPTRSGQCALTRGCDCGGGSTCGMYSPGEASLYWPNGCASQPWVILCQVRRR